MSTAQHIVKRAFSKAGIKPAETPLQPSESEDGLDALNDLLASWDASNVLKGVVPVSDIDAELEEPRYASGALKAQLAIKIAGEYGFPVTPAMAADVSQAMAALTTAQVHLKPQYPSTLPLGSGNEYQYGTGYDRDFFPEDNKENF